MLGLYLSQRRQYKSSSDSKMWYPLNCKHLLFINMSVMTVMQFRVRIFEHLGRSIRTNRPLGSPSFSAIRKHSEDTDHRIEIDSFSVLTSRANDMELGVVESLYTLRDKPSLCNNERSVELLCFWVYCTFPFIFNSNFLFFNAFIFMLLS